MYVGISSVRTAYLGFTMDSTSLVSTNPDCCRRNYETGYGSRCAIVAKRMEGKVVQNKISCGCWARSARAKGVLEECPANLAPNRGGRRPHLS